MNRLFVLLAALFSFVSAAPAMADPLLYTVTNANGVFASFTLDSHPTPDLVEDYGFFFYDVFGTYADGSDRAGLSFYDDSIGGGMTINTLAFSLADLAGITLFTGSTATPTLFAFGPTVFTDVNDGSSYTISAVAAGAVPEAATWAMLLIGFGMVGVGVRRRTAVAFA